MPLLYHLLCKCQEPGGKSGNKTQTGGSDHAADNE